MVAQTSSHHSSYRKQQIWFQLNYMYYIFEFRIFLVNLYKRLELLCDFVTIGMLLNM